MHYVKFIYLFAVDLISIHPFFVCFSFLHSFIYPFLLIRTVIGAFAQVRITCCVFFSFQCLWLIHSNFNAMHTIAHYLVLHGVYSKQMVLHCAAFFSFIALAKWDCVWFFSSSISLNCGWQRY